MKITIEINCDNAAFEDSNELQRILTTIKDTLKTNALSSSSHMKLFDSSGNSCGLLTVYVNKE